MDENDWLAEKFEENRGHLRAVAYRMLGSVHEADDAVQEAWLRLSRSDANRIENLGGWLTTVVAHVCLDILRSRTARREEMLDESLSKPAANSGSDPEHEALMADAIGVALLVILDRLSPAERIAFVLHDMFAVPFEEIAAIVGRTPTAARQLASRARRRVQGAAAVSPPERAQQRETVGAFIAALHAGDLDGLLAVLDPDVVVRIDEAAAAPFGAPREIRGAANWAKGAIAFAQAHRSVQPVLIDGEPGLVLAPHGRLSRALRFTITHGKIAHVEVIADPAHLRRLELAVFND